ncbi:MAG TPA: SGNH/GDSL hydrolase family protein [Pyrinomonadaceae bacterium]|nr:SGNH/GDSL hydrolase family protein [Pyrinomonadaceae bacterium]
MTTISGPPRVADSRREKLRRIALKAATTFVSTGLIISILFGVDLYLHQKHGVNLWGYRGPAAGRKQSRERRVAVLGGSTAWGFGLKAEQSFPAQLQQRLAEHPVIDGVTSIQLLNLASNSEGAYSFKYTLKDYDYLDYDVVLLYSGYNDLGQNFYVARHRSPIFLLTGYLPLLPTVTAKKIAVWENRFTGENQPLVFAPPGGNSDTGDQTSRALEKQLGPLTAGGQSLAESSGDNCPKEWQFYCQQIYEVTDLALKRGRRVLVVTEPYISDKHVEQQRALEAMLKQRFAGQAHFRYLNLGGTINLHDKTLCWDGMHLTEEGNRRVAEALVQPVLEILQR